MDSPDILADPCDGHERSLSVATGFCQMVALDNKCFTERCTDVIETL